MANVRRAFAKNFQHPVYRPGLLLHTKHAYTRIGLYFELFTYTNLGQALFVSSDEQPDHHAGNYWPI